MNTMQQHAAWLMSKGLTPIRIEANGKRPIDAAWQRTSYADQQSAIALFAAHSGNLGAALPPNVIALDLDTKNGQDGQKEAKRISARLGSDLPPTLQATTPSGGKHLLYRLPNGASARNAVGIAAGIDVRAVGGQIVVEPSSIDGKPYLWDRVSQAFGIAELPAAWVLELTKAQGEAKAVASAERRIPAGSRNAELASMAGTMRRAGFAQTAIAAALHRANELQCEPPLEPREIDAIANSVSRYAPEPLTREMFAIPAALPPGASPVPLATGIPEVSVADIFTRPSKPQRFVVESILPAGVVTLLGAHGGTGKSLLAQTMAVCVAAGLPFYGLAVEKGTALFFSGEDGADVVRRRLARICRHLKVDPASIAARLVVMDATDCPVLFNGAATPWFGQLRDRVEALRPLLILIDNASDVFDAKEIERSPVRAFVRLLTNLAKSVDAALLLLAHVDKATVKTGSSEGYIGSTAWHNSARSRLFMTGTAQGVEIEHQKSNLGPRAPKIHLRWTDDHVLELADAPGGAADEAAVLQLIAWANVSKRTLSPHPQAANYAFRMLNGESTFPKRMERRSFDAVLSRLIATGRVVEEEYQGNDRKTRLCLRAVRQVAAGEPPAPDADQQSAAGGAGLGVWGDRPHTGQADDG